MRKTLSVLFLLSAMSASAGTITSLSPASIPIHSGEYFMTIQGSGLGSQLLFDGPTGPMLVDINASDVGYVIGWIPQEIVNRAGSYTVSVLGGSGDSAPAPFQVTSTFKFRQPLTLILPEALVAIARGKSAFVRFDISTQGGAEDSKPEIRCDPGAGSEFGLGTTTVKCFASDQYGETAEGSFSVFVHDATIPVLNLPGRLIVKADSKEGSFVRYDVSASDDVDGVLEPECDAKSGSLFPVGITTVECQATDLSLNTVRGTFTVEVVNEESPFELHVPDAMVANAESREGASVSYDVYVTGSADPAPKISCDPPSGALFPMGTTTVYCRAEDAFGKSADGKFEVTVVDEAPPVIDTIAATPSIVDATGDFVPVVIDVKAYDAVDPMPRCSIVYVDANETISTDDWSVVSDLEVKLNATTFGAENRVYHVVVNCVDESQNQSFDEATVTVVPRAGEKTAPSPATSHRRSVRP